MNVEKITPRNRARINAFLREHWFTTTMIIRGQEVDMTTVDGLAVFEDEKIAALITYVQHGDILEITSLDSLREGQGLGTMLIREVLSIAKGLGCRHVTVITTNDNIDAIRFYQKRGFDMVQLYRNSMDISRKLKPEIPLLGEHDIPLRHEIEFEFVL